MKAGDIILKKDDLKSADLDSDLIIQDGNGELWCVALVEINGSKRISNDKADEIKKELENKTDLEWKRDTISNFVFHLVK